MQRADALERIAYELIEDAAADGVRYIEIRYAPVLCTREGLSLARRGRGAAARHRERASARTGDRGARSSSAGSAISIRRSRWSWPSSRWRTAGAASSASISPAVRRGTRRVTMPPPSSTRAGTISPCTVHAGEGDGAESVRQAVHECGAHRLGHATRLGRGRVAHPVRERPAHRARDLSHEQRADARRRAMPRIRCATTSIAA